jgi:hypothetical protein
MRIIKLLRPVIISIAAMLAFLGSAHLLHEYSLSEARYYASHPPPSQTPPTTVEPQGTTYQQAQAAPEGQQASAGVEDEPFADKPFVEAGCEHVSVAGYELYYSPTEPQFICVHPDRWPNRYSRSQEEAEDSVPPNCSATPDSGRIYCSAYTRLGPQVLEYLKAHSLLPPE